MESFFDPSWVSLSKWLKLFPRRTPTNQYETVVVLITSIFIHVILLIIYVRAFGYQTYRQGKLASFPDDGFLIPESSDIYYQ